jgi:nucleoside-diphosphate-sugar epimerase
MRGIIVTGASGFVGRHLLERLKDTHRVFALARRSQARCGAPVHPNIHWFQADVAERESLAPFFAHVRAEGGAEACVHLAAHYDFTGEESPEYWRTNVHGLRNVLDACEGLRLRRFVFSSSVAACRMPPPRGVLDETSPPDGAHVYSRTKAEGERLLADRTTIPSTVVRFAALFSDWCEYPPLFMFLGTWLTRAWNRSLLGGHGHSAVPYLHVEDATVFLLQLLDRLKQVGPGRLLIASPDGAVSHRELFEAATLLHDGRRRRPVLVPRLLCGPGMWLRDLFGRVAGERPFERPWMARYVDQRMNVDTSRTRAILGWAPRPRLEVLRRMPFLIENLQTEPLEWNLRNRAAMKEVRLRNNLRLHRLLLAHEAEIRALFTEALLGPGGRDRFPGYQKVSASDHQWHHRLILRQLMNAVRTREKAVFTAYCRDLAERRFEQGFEAAEVCAALDELDRICLSVLRRDPEGASLAAELQDDVTMTLRFGADQVQDVFERLGPAVSGPVPAAAARDAGRRG